ncbi:MAG: GNAT family N-acetyltransferase [Candidatus Halichondribacter symbioticus]
MGNNFQKGDVVKDWSGVKRPDHINHHGQQVYLEPLSDKHLEPLYRTFSQAPDYDWYYMPFGPFANQRNFDTWARPYLSKQDPLFFTIINQDSKEFLGFLSYLNINPDAGSIEIGFIQLCPNIQRSTGSTEAIWLLIKHAFELGYRRVEWKCDSLNNRSRKAATRLGFKFEGIFRQALVVKGRNRDTAWYSVIDKDWVALKKVFDFWFEHADNSNSYVSLSKLTNEMELE